jgi:hypothetical protein
MNYNDILLNRVASYLQINGKSLKSFHAIQKNITSGVDISLCLPQQIFCGYIVGVAGDCTFKSIFEGVDVFALVNMNFASLVYANSLTNTQGCYIIGYIIDWE